MKLDYISLFAILLITLLIVIFISGCVAQESPTKTPPSSATIPPAEPPKITPTPAPSTTKSPETASSLTTRQPSLTQTPGSKFALWQKPSFFRGAAVHPYLLYVQEGDRGYLTKQDLQDLRRQGANVVSLNYPGPFNVAPPYELNQDMLQYLDNAIDWAEEVGLYVVIHFRNGPGKSEGTFGSGEDKRDETLWYSQEEQAKWIEMWAFVAQRYRDRPHVIAYNLIVEPHPEDPAQQAPAQADVWNDLAKRITAAIRKVDKETPIIVSATVWSNPIAFSDLKPTGDSRTIYGFHMYEPSAFTHQGFAWSGEEGKASGLVYPGMIPSYVYEETRYWDKTLLEEFLEPVSAFQRANNVPIFVGEFGCNRKVLSCITYLADVLSIFEKQGWGYTFFIWRSDPVDPGEFDYEQEYDGVSRVTESKYMKLFKKYWSANTYFVLLSNISGLSGSSTGLSMTSTPTPASTVIKSTPPETSLKTLAEHRGIRFGSLYQWDFRGEAYDALFEKQMSVMSAATFFGDGSSPSRGEYDLSEMDEKVNWGLAHNMEVHGHVLIWYAESELPDWFKSAPTSDVEAIMNERIDTVVGRYKGKIKLWDVVNEAVNGGYDDDGPAGTLRMNNKWAEAMGTDYIRKAFVRAHAADPTAVLRYNDYNIESNQAKFKGVKNLLIDLKKQGAPVHALGWQMHVQPGSFDPATLLARMNEIADLGFDNYISELDVELPENSTAADYEAQKQTYNMVVETFLKARRHKTIVTWGLRDSDPYWLTENHPFIFDENLEKKPAYFGVQDALK